MQRLSISNNQSLNHDFFTLLVEQSGSVNHYQPFKEWRVCDEAGSDQRSDSPFCCQITGIRSLSEPFINRLRSGTLSDSLVDIRWEGGVEGCYKANSYTGVSGINQWCVDKKGTG